MTQIYALDNAPDVAGYVRGLTALGDRVGSADRAIFRAHYYAPERTATSRQLAMWAGIPGGLAVVNSRYGRLGHEFCDVLGIAPDLRPNDTARWWAVWSRGWRTPGGFVWQMLPQVADALKQLGWVEVPDFVFPEEVPASTSLIEGAVRQITVNAYERNATARRQCLAAWGTDCCICGFSFGAVYGPEADDYIHVHHTRPLSEIGHEYQVDPLEDLRPVCPNCHAVLHMGGNCRSIGEVRRLIEDHRRDA